MLYKAVPLAAWSFPKLIIRSFFPRAIYNKQLKKKLETIKENDSKKKLIEKELWNLAEEKCKCEDKLMWDVMNKKIDHVTQEIEKCQNEIDKDDGI